MLVLVLMLIECAPSTSAAGAAGVVTLGGIEHSSISITEGEDPFAYTISLSTRPTKTVWVATKVSASSGEDSAHLRTKLMIEPSVLIFEPEEWVSGTGPTKSLNLIAPDDYIAEETQRFYVEHVVASAAPEYSTTLATFQPQDRVEVEVLDNDHAAVAMTQSSFKSVGGMVKGAYAVGLRSEPLSPVAVMITSGEAGVPITFDPATIYFTRDQWHKPVQVRFEAQNTTAAALLGATVVHSSESRDANYDHSHCKFLPSDSFTPFLPAKEVV